MQGHVVEAKIEPCAGAEWFYAKVTDNGVVVRSKSMVGKTAEQAAKKARSMRNDYVRSLYVLREANA